MIFLLEIENETHVMHVHILLCVSYGVKKRSWIQKFYSIIKLRELLTFNLICLFFIYRAHYLQTEDNFKDFITHFLER